MPCLCTINTLRLFLKSVAHVDISASTTRAISKQWQKTAIRNFTSTKTICEPLSNSSASAFTSTQDTPFHRAPSQSPNPEPKLKIWPQEPAESISWRDAVSLPIEKPERLWKVVRRSTEKHGSSSTNSSGGRSEAETAPIKERQGPRTYSLGRRTTRPNGKEINDPSSVPSREGELCSTTVAEIQPIMKGTKTEHTDLTGHHSPPPMAPTTEPKSAAESKPVAAKFSKENDGWRPPPREHWQLDKLALKAKFPEGWKPLKKLSPDAMNGIRALHAQSPEQYTTGELANSFKISPEAIRRILKSKWRPDSSEETDRQRRWVNRGKIIYTRHAELGQKPPKKWRQMGIGNGKPEWMLKKRGDRAPLPGLITTTRARNAKHGLKRPGASVESLQDRIL